MDAKIARPLNELSATEIAARIAGGGTTCEAVTRDCLARIAARDDVVKAWVNFNPDLAIAQARALDKSPHRGPDARHSHRPERYHRYIRHADRDGLADLSGQSAARRRRVRRTSAACRRGILGKTATCEFAGIAPGETTNPHNLRIRRVVHRADRPRGRRSMVPAALGTQTGGSVLRPSSFCGIFGFKPTYNTFNKIGVWPAADTIDTIGLMRDRSTILSLSPRYCAWRRPSRCANSTRAADWVLAHGFLGFRAAGDDSGVEAAAEDWATPARLCTTQHCPRRSRVCME